MRKNGWYLVLFLAVIITSCEKIEDPIMDLEELVNVDLIISNPSDYPSSDFETLDNGICEFYVICDFKCSTNNWNDDLGAPTFIDGNEDTLLINGVLEYDISSNYGAPERWIHSGTPVFGLGDTTETVQFYDISISNGLVTGKVKILGDVGRCNSMYYENDLLTGFKFALIHSTLGDAGYSSDTINTYTIGSNSLETSQVIEVVQNVDLEIFLSQNYPSDEDTDDGDNCNFFVICDFNCSTNNWDVTNNAPTFIDENGDTLLINGVLEYDITSNWGASERWIHSGIPVFAGNDSIEAVKFYDVSIANNLVSGKVRIYGDTGRCDSMYYNNDILTSFRYALIHSTLGNTGFNTDTIGTYTIGSNSLQTFQ